MRLELNFKEVYVSDGGYKQGLTEGEQIGYEKGYTQGNTDGHEQGKAEGEQIGYEKGYMQGNTDGHEQGKAEGEQIGYENALSKLTELEVTENGEYIPENESVGFSSVKVSIGGGDSGENKLAKLVSGASVELTMADLGDISKIKEYAFYYNSNLTSIIIPNSVTLIDRYAFYSCTNLTSVTFAENSKFESISKATFESCHRLTSITIPDSVTSIGSYAFSGCSSLTSIIIPDSVKGMLNGSTFLNCTSLASVTIGKGITNTASKVFSGCTNLKKVRIEAETAPSLIATNVFEGVPSDCIFEVYNLDSYNSTNWVAIRDQYTFVEIEE